jgi:glycogen operon protein
MLGHGDELGRTQRGNNNAYCQDNDLAWIDWATVDESLLAFTREVIALRRAHPVFRQNSFFTGTSMHNTEIKDLAWFSADGVQMTASDWYDLSTHSIAMYLSGNDIRQVGDHGEPVVDDSFLVVIHAGLEPSTFTPPGAPWATSYDVVVDNTGSLGTTAQAGQPLDVPALTFAVLRVNA